MKSIIVDLHTFYRLFTVKSLFTLTWLFTAIYKIYRYSFIEWKSYETTVRVTSRVYRVL